MKLNDRQIDKLRDIAKVQGWRQLAYQSTSDVATLKALSRRGLIRARYVASRAWDAILTEAGHQMIDELLNRDSIDEIVGCGPGPWGE